MLSHPRTQMIRFALCADELQMQLVDLVLLSIQSVNHSLATTTTAQSRFGSDPRSTPAGWRAPLCPSVTWKPLSRGKTRQLHYLQLLHSFVQLAQKNKTLRSHLTVIHTPLPRFQEKRIELAVSQSIQCIHCANTLHCLVFPPSSVNHYQSIRDDCPSMLPFHPCFK